MHEGHAQVVYRERERFGFPELILVGVTIVVGFR